MNTTIAISKELKAKISELGRTGESYNDVVERMYEVVRQNMLRAYLYDTSDSISIDEAIAEAKKWPK